MTLQTDVDERVNASDQLEVSGATGQITRVISRRRSHRRQWRIFECVAILLLDATLVDASFRLAYALRYLWLYKNPFLDAIRKYLTETPAPHNSFVRIDQLLLMEIGIVVGAACTPFA